VTQRATRLKTATARDAAFILDTLGGASELTNGAARVAWSEFRAAHPDDGLYVIVGRPASLPTAELRRVNRGSEATLRGQSGWRPIGLLHIEVDRAHARGHLFLILHPSARRRGYGADLWPEIARAARALGLHKVEAEVAGWNTAMRAALGRATPMVREGVLRDHIRHEGRWWDTEVWGKVMNDE